MQFCDPMADEHRRPAHPSRAPRQQGVVVAHDASASTQRYLVRREVVAGPLELFRGGVFVVRGSAAAERSSGSVVVDGQQVRFVPVTANASA